MLNVERESMILKFLKEKESIKITEIENSHYIFDSYKNWSDFI